MGCLLGLGFWRSIQVGSYSTRAEEPRAVGEISDHFSDNAVRVSLCAKVCFVIAEKKCPAAGGEGLCVHTWTLVQLV